MARSAEELSELTEDERVALEEADTEEAGVEAEAAEAEAAADKAEADEAGEGESEAETEKPVEAEKPDEEPASEPDAKDETEAKAEDASPEPNPEPQRHRPQPENIDARIADLDAELDAVADKFDDGELTAKELVAHQRRINDERNALRTQQAIARAKLEDSVSRWSEETVPAFLNEHKQYANDEVRFTMLDAEVRRLQNAALDAGYDHMSRTLLEQAHKNITAAVQGLTGEARTDDSKAEADPAPKAAKEKPTRPDMPPTLANVPASDINETEGGKFAHLDRMAVRNPTAFEDALAKLSESDRDLYLAQQ